MANTRTMNKVTMTDDFSFPCPFCTGIAIVGHDENNTGRALHTLPMCKTFALLGADDYLHQVRTEWRRMAIRYDLTRGKGIS